MQSVKNILLILVTTVVVITLIVWAADSFGFENPAFAFLLNWLVLSWVAIIGQVIPISFSSGYYKIKTFEQSGSIYEQLGIQTYKKIVLLGPWAMLNQKLTLSEDRSSTALMNLESNMRNAETYHVIVFLLMVIPTFYAFFMGYFNAVGWLLVFNILINGYPIMLQRYNRNRVQQLLKTIGCR